MKDPKISVIVPVYKVEKYLERCVDSIINQTYKNLEIILIDDGSPDLCPVICDKYAEKDSRIIVIHKENGGLSDARNAGINVSCGEYIVFIDSDDFVKEKYIEKLYEAIQKDDSDLSMCGFTLVDEEGKIISTNLNNSPLVDGTMTGREVLEKYYGFNGWQYVVSWNKLYKREIFNKIRFPYGKTHEDEFVFHNIMFDCKKVSVICDKLLNYVQRDFSIMKTQTLSTKMNRCESLYNRLIFYREKGATSLLDKAVYFSFKSNFELLYDIYTTHESAQDYLEKLLYQMNDIWKNERAFLGEYSNMKFGLFKRSYKLYFLSVSLKSKLIHKKIKQ